jgi:hypothetical protein
MSAAVAFRFCASAKNWSKENPGIHPGAGAFAKGMAKNGKTPNMIAQMSAASLAAVAAGFADIYWRGTGIIPGRQAAESDHSSETWIFACGWVRLGGSTLMKSGRIRTVIDLAGPRTD